VLEIKGEEDTLFTPIVRSDYGRSLFAEGQLQQAEDQIRRVAVVNRRHYPESAALAQVLRTLAAISTTRGHQTEARQLFAEAAQAWSKGTGAALHPSRSNRFNLDEARLDLAMREPERALERLQRVVAPLNAASLLMHNEEAERDMLRARAYLQTGDTARALSLAREAHARVVTSPARTSFPALEADASVQLAQAQLAVGDAENARAYAERALALRREISHAASPWIAEAYMVLADALFAAGETARASDSVVRARAALTAQGDVGDQFRQPLLALVRRMQ